MWVPIFGQDHTRPQWLELINTRVAPAASFDHLIGAQQDRFGNGDADCLRGLEVDYQLEFCWLLHRKIRRPVPCRILCTYDAPRRNSSGRLAPEGMKPPGTT